MKNKKTIYHFIVDQSGSMAGLENQTIEGFNAQLTTIKRLKEDFPDNEYVVSVTYFEDVVTDIIRFGNVENIPLLTRENYQPGTTTALLDAIGKSADSIKEKFGKEINENLATVVVIILTDGHENTSQFYTYEQISKMIEELNATDKWLFTFLGAGINARAMTDRLNIKSENVVSFDRSDYRSMMFKVSQSVRNYEYSKNSGNDEAKFFDDDIN
jgi:hypothetical protein